MKKVDKTEAATLSQKAEEPLVKHKSKVGSLSSETDNLKLISETMKKTIAGKKTAITTILKPKKRQVSTSLSFPIVGMGASAGGLEALEQFFTNMPKDSGMAFVVIQHLDPNHVGMLPELLQRYTNMIVNQVKNHMEVKPNHVYVIPPNKSMSI